MRMYFFDVTAEGPRITAYPANVVVYKGARPATSSRPAA